MSEIRIEKKKSWMPWLIAALFAILAIWAAIEIFDTDDDEYDAIEMTQAPVPIDDDELAGVPVNTESENELESLDPEYDLAEYDEEWEGSKANFYTNYTHFGRTLEKIDAEMNLDHDYSNLALIALANSISSFADELGIEDNTHISERTAFIKEKAEQITKDPYIGKHADWIKAAAMSAVEALEYVQQQKFSSEASQITQLRQAAQSISKETLTLDQKATVRNFFQEAADVLKSWSEKAA